MEYKRERWYTNISQEYAARRKEPKVTRKAKDRGYILMAPGDWSDPEPTPEKALKLTNDYVVDMEAGDELYLYKIVGKYTKPTNPELVFESFED